jgi:hypothetical protein
MMSFSGSGPERSAGFFNQGHAHGFADQEV